MRNKDNADYFPDHNNNGNYHIFGQGSRVDGLHLFCAFLIVAAYLTWCGVALNYLEEYTTGTPYHLMMQRIYREIMMVGIGAFVFTIFNDTGKSLPFDFEPAFGFADVCCFVMSCSFCIYGIFIMLGSVGQAQNWSLASKITSEELHTNVERILQENRLMWRNRFIPFSVTREQVEFRILNAIFSSLYSISINHKDFDFGMFLTMSHEANILSIIDISPFKWCLVLIMAAATGLKLEFYDSSCVSRSCYEHEEVIIFTVCGSVVTLMSVLVYYWGRLAELKLLDTAGVTSIDDYPVFLLTEAKTRIALEQMTTGAGFAINAISELMKEVEESKLEQETKENLRRTNMIRRITNITGSKVSPYEKVDRDGWLRNYCAGDDDGCIVEEDERGDAASINRIVQGQDIQEEGEIYRESGVEVGAGSRGTSLGLKILRESSTVSAFGFEMNATSDDNLSSDLMLAAEKESLPSNAPCSPSNDTSINAVTDVSGSNIVRNDSVSGIASEPVSKVESNQIRTSIARHRSRRRSLLQNLKRTASGRSRSREGSANGGWRQSMEDFFQRRKSKMTAEEEKNVFKAKMKDNFQKQNLSEVFLFGRPELFYGLITVVITCNSFYLAWWITNFAMVASNLNNPGLIVLSLLPALVTTFLSALAIRSSSILKAITCLNLTVVAAVLDKSHSNAAALSTLRTQLLEHLSKEGPDIKLAMLKLLRRFSEDGMLLTRLEFEAILVHYRILYVPKKIDFLFRSIDANGGNTIEMGVSE